jgi:hypothetical protein
MKTLVKVSLKAAIFGIAVFTLSTCKDDKVKISGLDLKELDNVTVKVGETVTKTAKVTPANYNANPDEFTISATPASIATATGSIQGSTITVSVTGVSPGDATVAIKHTSGLQETKLVKVVPQDGNLTVNVSGTYTYTGSEIKPSGTSVVVKLGDTPLTAGTHYTLEYRNNTDVGTAYVDAKGAGAYAGKTGSGQFTIAPPDIALVSIAVSGTPKKTYWVGEEFDPAGITVTATFNYGAPAEIALNDPALVFVSDFTTAGNKTVTVKYTLNGVTKETQITGIEVNEITLSSIAVSGTPTKKEYEVGETFNPAGLTVTATYSNGATAQVPLDDANLKFECDFTSAGDNKIITVKYTYKGVTKEFKIEGNTGITVKEPMPTGLSITGTPEQTVYGIGEPFNPAGLTVTANYATGNPKTIPNDDPDLVWTFNNATASAGTNTKDKSVTAKYKEKEAAMNNAFTVRTLPWRIEAVPNNGTEIIYLYADEIISNQTITNKDITLIGVDVVRTIGHTVQGAIFNIGNNGNLTLGDKVTLDGSGVPANNNSLVTINALNALFVMKAGSKITGNNNTTTTSGFYGGAVFVNYGTFNMKGGIITGNKSYRGGGVYVTGTFNMSGGSIFDNKNTSENVNDVELYSVGTTIAKINLSGNSKIGNLTLYRYDVAANLTVNITDDFTGSVDFLDLKAYNYIANIASRWLNQQVVVKGSGVSDAQLVNAIGKFKPGNFVNLDATQQAPISPGYHIYGSEDGETTAADFGKLVRSEIPCSPTISNRTLTFSNITPSGFTVSWNKATGVVPEKLRYTVFILEPVWENGRLVWNYNTCNIGGTIDINSYNVVIPAHIETKGVYCYVRVENIDNTLCRALYDGANVTFR